MKALGDPAPETHCPWGAGSEPWQGGRGSLGGTAASQRWFHSLYHKKEVEGSVWGSGGGGVHAPGAPGSRAETQQTWHSWAPASAARWELVPPRGDRPRAPFPAPLSQPVPALGRVPTLPLPPGWGNVLATLHPNALAAQPSLQELHLPNNQLSQLQEVAMATGKLANLSLLDLDSNRISAPCPGPGLISMPFLRDLNLRNNSITWLDLARCSLPGLRSLNLTRNNMSGLEAGSFRAAPGLEKLSLDENPLNISHLLGLPLPNLTALHWSSMRPALDSDLGLACQVLGSLLALTSLDIKHSKVPPSRLAQLGACTNLTWLDLSTTPLSRLQGGVFRAFPRLESLSLDKCKIQQLKQSAWGRVLPQLRVLILRRNHLTKLEDGVFRPLSALTHLDLSRNRLTYLYKGTFLGMASLRTLLLQGCQLAAVTRDTFVYARKVEALDLSDNNLQYIKASAFQSLLHLRTLLLSGNRILTLQKWAFKGLTSLRHLSLAQNGLYKLSQGSFLGLKALETLDLSRNRLLAYGKYDSPAPFASLPALRGLDLGSQEAQPPVRLPSKLFQGLGNLQELSLRDNPGGVFLNLSLAPLAGLLFLDLSDIYPSREGPFSLRPGLFQGLGNLRRLSLNAWFQNWSAAEPGVQVALLGSYLCLGPGVSEGLFQAHDLSFCWADLGIVFFAGSFAAISLTLVGSLASAKLGWTLRYGFYLLRAWGRGRLRRDQRGYQYDAYVSCCAEDEAWVVHMLLAKLEEEGQPRFRLCFGPRDFAPGAYYLDNVQRGVSGSRKALCLLSARALESEWCSLEIHLACARAYYRGHDPLVVVFLEDIPNFRSPGVLWGALPGGRWLWGSSRGRCGEKGEGTGSGGSSRGCCGEKGEGAGSGGSFQGAVGSWL
uniref:TIR domain-containing protein n=1 Tax=Gopherus evgoodei TaxID=1825980 RepID=A0A8C4WDJ9_9SAUR